MDNDLLKVDATAAVCTLPPQSTAPVEGHAGTLTPDADESAGGFDAAKEAATPSRENPPLPATSPAVAHRPIDPPSAGSDWRAGEILRLTGLTSKLQRQLAEQAASQDALRRINTEYAARVGVIELQEEAARSRTAELAEVRQDAAANVAAIASLRHELAMLQQGSAESAAAHDEALRRVEAERSEREAEAQAVLRDRDQVIADLRVETARLSLQIEAMQRDLEEERRSRAAEAEAARRAAADACERSEASLEALRVELRGSAARADALDTRAAALGAERDRLRGWHDAVTATTRWHLVGRPGGRLDPSPGAAQVS